MTSLFARARSSGQMTGCEALASGCRRRTMRPLICANCTKMNKNLAKVYAK